ncbi:MAG: hypothetical protein P8X74_23715 [Reinekea sp.]
MINENTGETGGIYFSPGFDILIISSAIIIAYFISLVSKICGRFPVQVSAQVHGIARFHGT